jgi:hypothetical protein
MTNQPATVIITGNHHLRMGAIYAHPVAMRGPLRTTGGQLRENGYDFTGTSGAPWGQVPPGSFANNGPFWRDSGRYICRR